MVCNLETGYPIEAPKLSLNLQALGLLRPFPSNGVTMSQQSPLATEQEPLLLPWSS